MQPRCSQLLLIGGAAYLFVAEHGAAVAAVAAAVIVLISTPSSSQVLLVWLFLGLERFCLCDELLRGETREASESEDCFLSLLLP